MSQEGRGEIPRSCSKDHGTITINSGNSGISRAVAPGPMSPSLRNVRWRGQPTARQGEPVRPAIPGDAPAQPSGEPRVHSRQGVGLALIGPVAGERRRGGRNPRSSGDLHRPAASPACGRCRTTRMHGLSRMGSQRGACGSRCAGGCGRHGDCRRAPRALRFLSPRRGHLISRALRDRGDSAGRRHRA